MHNKEHRQQSKYYGELAKIIKNYEGVVLFSPTDAKIELLNVLKADSHFLNTKIDIEQTDKMTENQQHTFVKGHFS